MITWLAALRLLRALLPVQRLVFLAIPDAPQVRISAPEVLTCLSLLDQCGLLRRNGECLVRSLVCQRFLTLAGLQPWLLIGFDGAYGHAWVELDGQPVLEEASVRLRHPPVLVVYPGKRTLVDL